MLQTILMQYKECQNEKFYWEIKLQNKVFPVAFVLRVLFIIGDTDGHDKIAGRYTNRTNVRQLCRYCNIQFEETSNPEFIFKYKKHDKVFQFIEKANDKALKKFLCIK